MTRATLLAAGCAALALTLGACSQKAEDKAAEAPATAGTPAGAAPAAMKPSPGKWKMTAKMDGLPAGMDGLPPVEICLTKADIDRDAWATGPDAADNCSKVETRVAGGALVTHAVCSSNGITTTMDVTARGDMTKRYTVETIMKTEPAAPGAPNPMKMSVVAERLGDC